MDVVDADEGINGAQTLYVVKAEEDAQIGRRPERPDAKDEQGPVTAFTCEDIRVIDDDGTTVLYSGPKYLRCKAPECRSLVTHGMIQAHGACWCGNRRLEPAVRLRHVEQEHLKQGYYPLVRWEVALIAPQLPEGKTSEWGKAEFEAQYSYGA